MRCVSLALVCTILVILSLPIACAWDTVSVSLLPAPADMPFYDSLEEGAGFAAGWRSPSSHPGILCAWEQSMGSEGHSSIRLGKTSYLLTPPFATCWRTLKYDGKSPGIKVTMKVRAIDVSKASIDVQFCDADDNWTARRAAHVGIKISGETPIIHHWQDYSGAVEVPPGTRKIAVAVTLVSAGTIWFDEVRVECTDDFPKGEFLANVETAGLLVEDGFESGIEAPDQWTHGPQLDGIKYIWDKETFVDGSASLALEKKKGQTGPEVCWRRTFEHKDSADILDISIHMKAEKLLAAAVDIVFRDEEGAEIRQNLFAIGKPKVNIKPISHEWKTFATQVRVPDGTATITIELQILGRGRVYFDGLSMRYPR